MVDIGIYEAVLAMTESTIPEYALAGQASRRTASILPRIAPSNIYPTSDGDYVLIGANAGTVFGRFAEAIGRPEWASEEEYATHHARGERQRELDEEISAWTWEHTGQEIIEAMREAGVPCRVALGASRKGAARESTQGRNLRPNCKLESVREKVTAADAVHPRGTRVYR